MFQRIAATGLGFAFAVLASAISGGCAVPLGCSLMGCADGATVSLEPPLTEEGAYRVEVDIDDETLGCEVVRNRICENGIWVQMPSRSSEVGEGDAKRIKVVELPGIESIRLDSRTPESFTLRVYRDEALVLSETVTPSYRKYQPNGPECDGDLFCRDGDTTLRTD